MRNIFTTRLVLLLVVMMVSITMAQVAVTPDPTRPDTWFLSPEAVIILGGILAGYLTKVITALGKDWLDTEGQHTMILAAVIAFIVAGIGGYFSLGYFSDASGLDGAAKAIFMVAWAWLQANGVAKYDRQVEQKTIEELERTRRLMADPTLLSRRTQNGYEMPDAPPAPGRQGG